MAADSHPTADHWATVKHPRIISMSLPSHFHPSGTISSVMVPRWKSPVKIGAMQMTRMGTMVMAARMSWVFAPPSSPFLPEMMMKP